MGIGVEVRDEQGGIIQRGGSVDARDLPAFDDMSYPHLRLVDAYGDTVFSSYQLKHAVLAEIERLSVERPSPASEELLKLARRCVSELHSYLWFIGD